MKKLMFLLVACICIYAVSASAFGCKRAHVEFSLDENLVHLGYHITNICPKGAKKWYWETGKRNVAFQIIYIHKHKFKGGEVSFYIWRKGTTVCHVHRKIGWKDAKTPGTIPLKDDNIDRNGYKLVCPEDIKNMLSFTISSKTSELWISSIALKHKKNIEGNVVIYKNGERLTNVAPFSKNSPLNYKITDFKPEKDKLKIVVSALNKQYSLDYGTLTLKSINEIKVFAVTGKSGQPFPGILPPASLFKHRMRFVLDKPLIDAGCSIKDIKTRNVEKISKFVGEKTKKLFGFQADENFFPMNIWFTIMDPNNNCHVHGKQAGLRTCYFKLADDETGDKGYAVKYEIVAGMPDKELVVIFYRPGQEDSSISPTAPL